MRPKSTEDHTLEVNMLAVALRGTRPSSGGIAAASDGKVSNMGRQRGGGRCRPGGTPNGRASAPCLPISTSSGSTPSSRASRGIRHGSAVRPLTSPAFSTAKRVGATEAGPIRPSTSGSSSWSGSPFSRFSIEEKNCFKRVHTPSSTCNRRLEAYFASTGQLRQCFTNEGLNMLPVLKGDFYQHPAYQERQTSLSSTMERARNRRRAKEANDKQVECLPQESITSTVLEEIYPRTPSNAGKVRRSSVTTSAAVEHHSPQDFSSTRSSVIENSFGVEPPSATRHFTQSGSLSASGSGWAARSGMQQGGSSCSMASPLLDFRRQLLMKFPNVKVAFETFAVDLVDKDSMTKKDWRRVLLKHGFVWPSTREREALFDQLEFSGDGVVSCIEFQAAVEAVAPVRCLEDLRRRWLACGYGSMLDALNLLDGNGQSTRRRMTLKEFGEAMSRVRVTEPSEHAAIFNLVCIDGQRISIGDLASAIATVSPCLILEDIRDRLVRKYGKLEKAFVELDLDRTGLVRLSDWRDRTIRRIGITEMEATIAFRLIDLNGSGEVSKSEFMSSLALSEPLVLEEFRRKIRQRFRSIRMAFEDAINDLDEVKPMDQCYFSLQKFKEVLEIVDVSKEETTGLFEILDINHQGELTPSLFLRGLQYFAPSCVLEDLRLRCLQLHLRFSDAFDSINVDKSQPLDYQSFLKVLEELDFASGIKTQTIFDLLDVKYDGTATIYRLVAALQSGGPGALARLPSEERDFKAKHDARCCLAGASKIVSNLKQEVRTFLISPNDSKEGDASPRSAEPGNDGIAIGSLMPVAASCVLSGERTSNVVAFAAGKSQVSVAPSQSNSKELNATRGSIAIGCSAEADEEATSISGSISAPRLKTTPHEELAPFVDNIAFRVFDPRKTSEHSFTSSQESWGKVWSSLMKAPPVSSIERSKLQKELHVYFQNNTASLSHDVPLLQDMQSQLNLHLSTKAHVEALSPQKVKAQHSRLP